jgi:hypothetical protein
VPDDPKPGSEASRARLRRALEARATERSRSFWTGYVKGSPPFLGVAMADVRAALGSWWRSEGIDAWPAPARKRVALSLFTGAYAEDRLAGILALAERLDGDVSADDLPAFAELFGAGRLADWNLTDWFCIKVLGPLIRLDPARFAQTGVGWTLRELARSEPERVEAFVERHLGALSLEAIRSIGKGRTPDVRDRWVAAKKAHRRLATRET